MPPAPEPAGPRGRPIDAWLDERIGRIRSGSRVLALCRSRATAAAVRRWALRRGGLLGLEATTPAALAAQVRAPDAPRAPACPDLPGGPFADRVGDRPGLLSLARRWARVARARRALGLPGSAPEWLEGLLATDFGRDDDDEALLQLLAAARLRGARLSASAHWDRVVAIGFHVEPEHLDPLERAVVEALASPDLEPPEAAGPLPARAVPDVVAEARCAVEAALADPEGTLVLVGTDATGRRVRDALARSGLGATWRDGEPLGAHPLAAGLRRAVAWFAPEAQVLGSDLAAFFARAAVGRGLDPVARAWCGERGADGAVDERGAAQVLEATRLRDAPLDAWIARVAEGRADADRSARFGAASVAVEARLRLVAACARGEPLETWLPTARPAALDDFEDALRDLLGDVAVPSVPAPGTLGGLKRLLVGLRVRLHDDPVARAILGALHQRAALPATPARVHEALAGPGLDPGVLPEGVDVLSVDDWDGRPCRTLVVLDVHDHGLAHPIPPDPLLRDPELRRLGVPTGADRLRARLRLVRRAAARAGRVLALVTATGASGRAVVPPLGLALAPGPGEVAPYGLDRAVPELARHARLGPGAADTPPAWPAVDPERVRLARGATAEWFLAGRLPGPELPLADAALASLAEVLRQPLDPCDVPPPLHGGVPPALGPWLGDAGPDGALVEVDADGAPLRHSVSRLLQPLARCAWQAFARVILRVEPPIALTDALDPRELGRAAHAALERAAPALPFGGGDEDELQARTAALGAANAEAFAEALAPLGPLSAARLRSAEGARDRWGRHWASWVRTRAAFPRLGGGPLFPRHPAVSRALAVLRGAPELRDAPDDDLRRWIVEHGGDAPELPDAVLLAFGREGRLPAEAAGAVRAALAHPALADVGELKAELGDTVRLLTGRPRGLSSASELPFGEDDRPPVPVHGLGGSLALPAAKLRFGSKDLYLRGSIDRVDWVDGPGGAALIVTDFKTGTAERAGWMFRDDQLALGDPQLLVYAMVLSRALREGELGGALGRGAVAAVAHDRVRHTFRDGRHGGREPERPDTWLPVDARLLRWVASELGAVVDLARGGRWPLRPHPRRCPKLVRGAVCEAAAGCRLRELPRGAGEAPAEPA